MSWLNITMQNTHTLSKRIAAGKHDLDSCKNIFNICTPIMFSGNKRNAAQFFFLFLKHCHLNMNLKYSKWNSGFQDRSMAKECQMAMETFVFLKSKVSRRKNRNGMLYPSHLELQLESFKIADIMNSQQLCEFLTRCGCWLLLVSKIGSGLFWYLYL